MSFILDALRKSEHQRQRHVGPSLADAPLRRRQYDRPWWAVIVVALLVVNLGVLLIVLMRDGGNSDAQAAAMRAAAPATTQVPPPPSQSATVEPATAATRPVPRPAPAAAPRSTAVRSLADEANGSQQPDPPYNPALAAAANVPPGPPRVRPIEAPAVAPLRQGASASRAPEEEVLPDVGELAMSGAVPDLHLDIHVYSNVPAERFVFINMRKYTEGQALIEGPMVEHIRADGVVLNQQGRRFLLPRQ